MKKKTATAKSKAQKGTLSKVSNTVRADARKVGKTIKADARAVSSKVSSAAKKGVKTVKRAEANVARGAKKTVRRVESSARQTDSGSHGFMIFLLIAMLLILALVFIVNQSRMMNRTQTQVLVTPTTPMSPPPAQNVSLADSMWVWTDTLLPDETTVAPIKTDAFTLKFTGEDNGLSITTDCNNGRSSYTVSEVDESLTIAPIASTMKFCMDSQENEFTSELAGVESYVITGSELSLTLNDGAVMHFARLAN